MLNRESETAGALLLQQPPRLSYRMLLRYMTVFGILVSVLVTVASSRSGRRGEEGLVHDPFVGIAESSWSHRHRLKRSLPAAIPQQQQNKSPQRLVSKYANLTYIEALDIVPPTRLFVIGDVHGCLDELNTLITKIGYDHARGDRLIFLGDLMAKGPNSLGVVQRARELNAWCVRGNHDDKVIRIATFLQSQSTSSSGGVTGVDKDHEEEGAENEDEVFPEGEVHDPIKKKNKHVVLARELMEDQQNYAYLARCPMILAMPALKSLFVHAGLDPAKALDQQEPFYVMNMRMLRQDGSPAQHRSEGVRLWAEGWDQIQAQGNAKTLFSKVYYGHSAANKLQLRQYSFGIDTGCVYGGELSAMEVHSGSISQVKCTLYAEHD